MDNKKRNIFFLYFKGLKIAYSLDKKLFWMQIANSLGNVIIGYLSTIIAAIVINGVVEGKDKKELFLLAIIVVFANFIFQSITLITSNRRYIRKSMWPWFMSDFFNKKARKMAYFHLEEYKTKELRLRIERQIYGMKGIAGIPFELNAVVSGLIGIVGSISIFILMVLSKPNSQDLGISIFINSLWAFFIYIIIVFLNFLITWKISEKKSEISTEINSNWAKISKKWWRIEEFLTDSKLSMDIKIYGMDNIIEAEYNNLFKNDIFELKKLQNKKRILSFIESINNTLVVLFTFLYVVLKAFSGAFEVGSIVFFVANCNQFRNAISGIGKSIGSIRGQKGFFEDQFKYIELSKEDERSLNTFSNTQINEIEFKNISFKYSTTSEHVLKNISFKIPIGKRVAIVGANGSGKTTLIKLLCGLYRPTSGEILFNGINTSMFSQEDLMKLFAIVFQDFKIFSFPISENVAVNKNFDEDVVTSMLVKSGFEERLKTLPFGIKTCISKNFDKSGVDISGGEAQKIAIARALFKNANVIILDEPTAQLDPISEAETYEKFSKLADNKTAIYISHRLSSCKFCDEVFVLEDGCLIEHGSHEQLVGNENSYYFKLWNAQAQYYRD
ncbi:MAG: ABC transporter ATP-binding protein [Synergistaceae bacterium]|nr:ABC transporter ATP-binding protein [Synergistaceae bacterium]